MQTADINKCPEWQKHAVIVLDEMHINQDLVYSKHTGVLVEFSDFGNINSHLLQFQASLGNESSDSN